MVDIVVPLTDVNAVVGTDHHSDALPDHIVKQLPSINRPVFVCDSLDVVFAGDEH